MCTRGAWQLQRLVVRYCDWGGSSAGAREFVRTDLPRFARQNPQIQVQTEVLRNRHPILIGEYEKFGPRVVSVRNLVAEEVARHTQKLRDSDGRKIEKIRSFKVSKHPSVQGWWRPKASAGEMAIKHVE